MADLTGKRIDQTYEGLIKTNDEQPIDGTLKTLQDGVGNNLPVQVSTGGINFTGTVTGDNNSKYALTSTQTGANVTLEFEEIGVGVTDILFVAGNNITLSDNGGNEITIAAAGGSGTPITYTIDVDQATPTTVLVTLTGSDGSTDSFTLSAGGNVSISAVGDVVTFSATDTNTTYDYSGTDGGSNTYNLNLTPSIGTADTVQLIGGDNITLTDSGSNRVTIDAQQRPQQATVYQNKIYNPGMGVTQPSEYGKFIQPIVGKGIGIFEADNQTDDTTMFTRLYAEPGTIITELHVPVYGGPDSDFIITLYAEGPQTGQPYNKIVEENYLVPNNIADGVERFTLTTPIAVVEDVTFWVGINTNNDRKVGQISGDHVIHTFSGWGTFGTGIDIIDTMGTLYFIGVVPDTILEPHDWTPTPGLNAIWFK